MVNVTNRANVAVRLVPLEFFLGHFSSSGPSGLKVVGLGGFRRTS
jgi:hypothetical protein